MGCKRSGKCFFILQTSLPEAKEIVPEFNLRGTKAAWRRGGERPRILPTLSGPCFPKCRPFIRSHISTKVYLPFIYPRAQPTEQSNESTQVWLGEPTSVHYWGYCGNLHGPEAAASLTSPPSTGSDPPLPRFQAAASENPLSLAIVEIILMEGALGIHDVLRRLSSHHEAEVWVSGEVATAQQAGTCIVVETLLLTFSSCVTLGYTCK